MVIGQKTKEVATINGMPLPDPLLRFVFFQVVMEVFVWNTRVMMLVIKAKQIGFFTLYL